MGEEIYHLNEVASNCELTNEESERLHLRRREDATMLSMRPCVDYSYGRAPCFQGCRFMHVLYHEDLSDGDDDEEVNYDEEEEDC